MSKRKNAVQYIQWHVWRINRDVFGLQNIGSVTARRVTLFSHNNEVIDMGDVEKKAIAPYEWFDFVIMREFQEECKELIVVQRLKRGTRYEIPLDMRWINNIQQPQ